LSSLPAKTRPEGFAPDGCHAAREHGSTCQLSALPHGAAARTTVCMFGSLKPSDRSSGLRSFGLSEADHSGSLSGSRPMQQRLVCVEAGQTFSIQRMEVLTPQVSSIHCRLTRGRSLVRSQSGPRQIYAAQMPNLGLDRPPSDSSAEFYGAKIGPNFYLWSTFRSSRASSADATSSSSTVYRERHRRGRVLGGGVGVGQ